MARTERPVRLRFVGAAGTVTGSCIEVRTAQATLLVDCGLFQGPKSVTALNYGPLRVRPGELDAVLLTHAHVDHVGLVPRLAHFGYAGPIHATRATLDLLDFVLRDSAAIQENEVERLNRRRRRRGEEPVEPIYTAADAEAALALARPVALEDWFEPAPGVRARFWNAGHILGSASIELAIEADGAERPFRLLLSGDLGPDEKMFHPPPDAPQGFDVVVCESTYGDRDREDVPLAERRRRLKVELDAARAAGGNVLIPAFAVERTQELLVDILALMRDGAVETQPVFLDSPLASRATEVFAKHQRDLEDVPEDGGLFQHPALRITQSVADSQAINRIKGGAIVVAASGMCEAGRIRHHLKHNLWRREATVLFVGYQAPGTLGRILQEGAEEVRIHGTEVAVRARLRTLGHYSAHADQAELARWILDRQPIRQAVILNHGEDAARATLRDRLLAAGLPESHVLVPDLDETLGFRVRGPALRETPAPPVPADARTWDAANAEARFRLRLGERLAALPDDRARRRLLDRLDAMLEPAPHDEGANPPPSTRA